MDVRIKAHWSKYKTVYISTGCLVAGAGITYLIMKPKIGISPVIHGTATPVIHGSGESHSSVINFSKSVYRTWILSRPGCNVLG